MSASVCPSCSGPLARADALCPRCLMSGFLAHQVAAVPAEGVTFGDYELRERIGSGGMGVVYRARHSALHRTVALKMLKGGRLAEDVERRRFTTEAEAVARLEHPHIVPVFEVGEYEEQPFYTMRLIEGGRSGLDLRTAGARTAALTLATIARAVHYAHQRGILHRDLKPANILLDAEGAPFVTDFGLAKFMETDSSLTVSGAVLGTPAYMAPEVATGGARAATVASDVYSLGAILYEWLAGRPPFSAGSTMEMLRKIATAEPPALPPGGPKDPATIALKCLSKQPDRRYSTAATLADDLERWLRGEPITARPVSTWERTARWCRRKPALAALLGLSVAGTFAFVWQTRASNSRLAAESTASQIQARKALEAESRANASSQAARQSAYFSSVFAASRARLSGEYTLARRLLNEQPPVLRGLEWRVMKAACTEGPPLLEMSAAGPVRSLALAPDGRFLFVVDNTGLHSRDLLDGRQVDGIFPDAMPREGCTAVLTDPAGKWIALASRDGGTSIWKWTTGANGPFNATFKRSPDSTPDSTPASPAGTKPDDPKALPALEQITVLSGENAALTVSGDGAKLLVRTHPDTIPDEESTGTLYDTATWHPGRIFARCGPTMALNRDGSRLAVTRRGEAAHILDTATGTGLCIVQSGGGQNALAFNKSGDRLATSLWNGRAAIFDATTGEQKHLLDEMGETVQAVAWLDDAYLAAGGSNHAVKVWSSDEGVSGAAYDHAEAVTALLWYQPGNHLITGGYDGKIVLRDILSPAPPFQGTAGVSPPLITFPASKLITGCAENGKLVLCDPVAGKVLKKFTAPPASIRLSGAGEESIFFLQHYQPSAVAGFLNKNSLSLPEAARQRTGLLESWRFIPVHAQTGVSLREVILSGVTSSPRFAAVSRNGTTVALLRAPKLIGVWDGTYGELRRDIQSDADVQHLLLSPDGTILFATTETTWSAWATTDGGKMWSVPFPGKSVSWLSANPGMTLTALSMKDGTIDLYSLTDGQKCGHLTGHSNTAGECAWTPDGTRLISSTALGDVRLWDVESRREIATLGHAAGLAHHMTVTGDGLHLIMCSYGGQMFATP